MKKIYNTYNMQYKLVILIVFSREGLAGPNSPPLFMYIYICSVLVSSIVPGQIVYPLKNAPWSQKMSLHHIFCVISHVPKCCEKKKTRRKIARRKDCVTVQAQCLCSVENRICSLFTYKAFGDACCQLWHSRPHTLTAGNTAIKKNNHSMISVHLNFNVFVL